MSRVSTLVAARIALSSFYLSLLLCSLIRLSLELKNYLHPYFAYRSTKGEPTDIFIDAVAGSDLFQRRAIIQTAYNLAHVSFMASRSTRKHGYEGPRHVLLFAALLLPGCVNKYSTPHKTLTSYAQRHILCKVLDPAWRQVTKSKKKRRPARTAAN